MAKVEFNSSVSQVHGKVDRWVYRERDGRAQVFPYQKQKDRPTPAQLGQRQRFRDAQAYAKSVLADPLKSLSYRKLAAERGGPANAILVANFYNPPVIEQVDLSAYRGQAGDLIRVLATDAIEVAGVTITIRDAGAAILETGAATKDHSVWVYRSTTSPTNPASAQIEVIARNFAGAKVTASYPSA
jgi:hypothetical protein